MFPHLSDDSFILTLIFCFSDINVCCQSYHQTCHLINLDPGQRWL